MREATTNAEPVPPLRVGEATAGWAWPAASALLASASYLLARAVALGPKPGPWAYWPILGILCGIFTRRPPREWWRIALGAATSQTLTIYLVRGDLAHGATVVGALGGVAEAMLGAALLRKSEAPGQPLKSARDFAVFVVGVVFLVPLAITPMSAYGFAFGLHLSFRTAWWPLFIGNALSLLIFAPLVALPWRKTAGERAAWTAGPGEVALCQASILVLSLATFAGRGHWLWFLVLPYVMFPLLVWAALRCGPHWTATSVATLATVSAWFMARTPSLAEARDVPLDQRVLEWQSYLAFAAFTALLLSTLTEQRRRAFAALALQGSIQRAVFESSSAVIALRDLEHRYVLVNRAAELALGKPRAQILGRPHSEVLRAADAARAAAHDRRVVERGEPLTFEEPVQVGDELRHFLTIRFPVRGERGEIRYVGEISRDDTLERELSDRLQRLTRTELIGQLAAGLAHDVNNLLTVVVNNATLLREGGQPPSEVAAMVEELGEAGKRAARLTGRLLALGRRRPAAAGGPVEVDEAVEALAQLLRAMVRGNVDLTLQLGARGAAVSIDRSEIEQIVLNLVSNARDAIAGQGRIAIATEIVPAAAVEDRPAGVEAERWLRLRVSDTGSGMDEATLSRLFEPFFTTKEKANGTGLGLYTTSLLVREAGGAIRASGAPGRGSTLVVDLPLAEPRRPA